MFMSVPYEVINHQVHVQPAAMVSLVETYLAHKKNIKVRVKPLTDQESVRKLGVAFDVACQYFGIQNPFHLQFKKEDLNVSHYGDALSDLYSKSIKDTFFKGEWKVYTAPDQA